MTKDVRNWRDAKLPSWVKESIAEDMQQMALKARADRAEAALAAQIEVDAGIAKYYANQDYCAMGYPEDGGIAASGTAETIRHEIRSQPHDRTALDRMLAEAREKALREAALVAWNFEDGDRWTRASVQAAILSMIEVGE